MLQKQFSLVTLNRTPLQADDTEITEYLTKFGTLKGPCKRRTYPEGPLKDLENGSITALMTLAIPMSSYHYLRRKRFEAYYKGMVKTCFWCLKPGENVKIMYWEMVMPARCLAPKKLLSNNTSLAYGPTLDGTRTNMMKKTIVANPQLNQQPISP